MDFASIPIIVVCCYMVGEIYKVIFRKKSKAYKLIPILVALFGGAFGLLIYYTEPKFMFNVDNFYSALLIGLLSGFASTGANQVVKQLMN